MPLMMYILLFLLALLLIFLILIFIEYKLNFNLLKQNDNLNESILFYKRWVIYIFKISRLYIFKFLNFVKKYYIDNNFITIRKMFRNLEDLRTGKVDANAKKPSKFLRELDR